MTALNAENFEDLAQQSVTSGYKDRMLYVFVRAEAVENSDGSADAEDGATMVQILFDAHQPAVHGMNFEALRATADAQNPTWNMIVVGIARNSDASLPTPTQAQEFLTDMRAKILLGEIDGYVLLDRDGIPLDVSAEVVPVSSGASLN